MMQRSRFPSPSRIARHATLLVTGMAMAAVATNAAAAAWLTDAQRRAFAFDKETARSFAEGIIRNLAAHKRDDIDPDKLDFMHPLMLSGQQLPPAEMRFITVAFPAIK